MILSKVETTKFHTEKFKKRYRYFEIGHICKFKNQKNVNYLKDFNEMMLCDCGISSQRMVRKWWRPFEVLGEKLDKLTYYLYYIFTKFKNGKFQNPYTLKPWSTILWFIRKHLTYT
jgi:hypothetical protein